MEKSTITKLNKSFEESAYEQDGIEYWLARELQELLGYADWRNFMNAVDKAKESCKTTGEVVSDHFVDVTKTIPITAKQLATEITNFNVKKNDLKGEAKITREHVKNNNDVRTLLGKSGIKPEQLPPEEDIKKLERKVKSADKEIVKKKLKGKK